MVIKFTCRNNVKYDLHDVLMVVKVHQNPNEFETVNISTDYPSIKTVEVAHINAW